MQMAKELNAILDHGKVQPAGSCTGDNGSVSYLEQAISPIYETMATVSALFLISFLIASTYGFTKSMTDSTDELFSPTCYII